VDDDSADVVAVGTILSEIDQKLEGIVADLKVVNIERAYHLGRTRGRRRALLEQG
jgi:hypothetical protein